MSISKRLMDVAGAIFGLTVLAPLLTVAAPFIVVMPRNFFYGQLRLGKNAKRFRCWKIRTMVVNADDVLAELLETNAEARKEWEVSHKLKNDPRITPIGGYLRRTSLDELPQFWNVLLGQMSLVGPRPITNDELKKYGRSAPHYLKTKPGMTGLWQAYGRSDVSYRRRVAMDRWYSSHRSMLLDIKIILKTIVIILKREGAY